MSTVKKVGGINEYEVNSISAGNIEIYMYIYPTYVELL
jgi:hypothetical protein